MSPLASVLLLLSAGVVHAALPPSATDPASTEECDVQQGPRKTLWISSIVAQALADYVPSGEYPLDPCTKDGQIYAENLANLTYWATKMYDSSSLGMSPGILEGRNFDFGHFDECVSAKSTYHRIQGKYLVAQLIFEPDPKVYPNFLNRTLVYKLPNEEASSWEAVKPTLDKRVERRNAVSWAVCVPSSCTDREVETSLQRKLYPALSAHRVSGNLTVLPEYSYSRADHRPPHTSSYYIFLGTTILLFALVLASTIYEANFTFRDTDIKPWFLNFSLVKNATDLFKIPKNEFVVMSGLKATSMFSIIFGHRMMISISNPQYNPNNIHLATGESYLATIVDNGTLVVNTFLTITGFLTFYKITKDLYNDRDLQVAKNICNRFFRLTPAYLFVVSCMYFITPNIEGGPLSRAVVWDAETFGNYWWSHFSYLNNYVKATYQILLPSWYIAMDMQMYVFAYLLGGLLQRMKNLTPYLLSLSTIVSLSAPAITVACTKYWGTYLIFHTKLMDFFYDPEFRAMYMPTHVRSSPYIIGMFGGYIYYQMKDKKVTFQKRTVWVWSAIFTVVFFGSLIVAFPFYIPGREYVLWENIAYTVLHRIGWSMAILWIIISTTIGNFGPFKFAFGLKVYEVFNKLTYTALLVHTPIQMYLIGFIRAPINYGRIIGIWMACGDIVFTYIISAFVYLLVEAPFSHLQQKLWDLPLFNKLVKKEKTKETS